MKQKELWKKRCSVKILLGVIMGRYFKEIYSGVRMKNFHRMENMRDYFNRHIKFKQEKEFPIDK